jgi:hypothetical protein
MDRDDAVEAHGLAARTLTTVYIPHGRFAAVSATRSFVTAANRFWP